MTDRAISLNSYLQNHFVDKARFASLAGITIERLDMLIGAGAIPEPTYVCNDYSIRSAAFGTIVTEESIVGEWYRPECARWVGIADQAIPGLERDAVMSVLAHELEIALRTHLADPAAIEEKVRDFLPYFFDGTFGLCVADPSTGAGIARKEILQERLTGLTQNGSNPSPEGISSSELLQLIDDYAFAAMPFSPAEYERSSVKRLVDDLRCRVPNENGSISAPIQ